MHKLDSQEQETVARILKTAGEIFAEEGFAGARIDELARRAKVNKATLYYQIGDKAEIYAAVIVGMFRRISERLDAILAESLSPREKFRQVLTVIVTTASANPHLPRIMLREVAGGGANLPDEALLLMGKVFLTVRQLLAEGAAAGEFRAVNPLTTHFQIIGSAMLIIASQPLRARLGKVAGIPAADQTVPPDELAASVIALIFNGLLARPAEVKQ